jgi:hypothetical protein
MRCVCKTKLTQYLKKGLLAPPKEFCYKTIKRKNGRCARVFARHERGGQGS